MNEQELLNSANAKLLSNDHAGAVADCDQVIKLNPDNAEAYNIRGLAKFSLRRSNDAIIDFDKAIKLDPQFTEAYNNRGFAKFSLKRSNDAIIDFDKAIKLDPQFTGAYSNRGLAKAELGRYNDAITDFDKTIKLDPQHAEAYCARGLAKADLKQYDHAINDYNQAMKLDPQHAGAYYARGIAKANLKQYDHAITDFNQAIKLNPQYAEAYHQRGLAKFDLKQYGEAITDFNQAIKLNPQYAEAYNNRGAAKIRLKQYDGAIADFDKVLRMDPADQAAIHNRAVAMAFKQSDASLKEVTAKVKDRLEKQEKEYKEKILDQTPYSNREKKYNKAHIRLSIFAHTFVIIIALISFGFIYSIFGSDFWPNVSEKSPYNTIPIILAFAGLVVSPLIWQAHILFREAAKRHALEEDAFTKGQITLFIATGNYDDKTRYRLIQRFITYHEKQSSAHLILNTKPPSIPQKSGFDAINLKNLIKSKGK